MSKWELLREDKPYFCCECTTPMKLVIQEYSLGRDCLGEQYETVYYRQCTNDLCRHKERIFGTHD